MTANEETVSIPRSKVTELLKLLSELKAILRGESDGN